MARSLVRAAKFSGADAVKFQHHIVDAEMINNNLSSTNFDESLYDFLNQNALTLDQHIHLKDYCEEQGIQYLCTPFSIDAAHEIKSLVPFFKIGSGEFLDFWFIDQLREIGKPVIFSSGMSTDAELNEFIERYSGKIDFALLNCLSEYPPKYEDLNLNYIRKIKRKGNFVVGHSDHTPTIESSISAVTLGAQIIEKHITISEHVRGPDATVSLNPTEFAKMVSCVRNVRKTLGEDKIINELEQPIRNWAHRSIVTKVPIAQGQKITYEMICTKRPGTGLPSKDYQKIIGKIAALNIPCNSILEKDMLLDE